MLLSASVPELLAVGTLKKKRASWPASAIGQGRVSAFVANRLSGARCAWVGGSGNSVQGSWNIKSTKRADP
jgi:hypothetical protein